MTGVLLEFGTSTARKHQVFGRSSFGESVRGICITLAYGRDIPHVEYASREVPLRSSLFAFLCALEALLRCASDDKTLLEL